MYVQYVCTYMYVRTHNICMYSPFYNDLNHT